MNEPALTEAPPPLALITAFLVGSAIVLAALLYFQSWIVAGYTLLFFSVGLIAGWLRAVIHCGRLRYYVLVAICIQFALVAITALLGLLLFGLVRWTEIE